MPKRLEDEDKEALATLASAPPPHKAHSYTHNLRTNTGSNLKRRNYPRNHSLDDDSIITTGTSSYDDSIIATGTASTSSYDDSGEEFLPYATTASGEDDLQRRSSCRSSSSHQHSPIATQTVIDNNPPQSLPLIVAAGGNGIFKAPVRAAVHPGRPPFLELRPHPLRETQVGMFLRTIACTESQLWAGLESGVRVWDLNEAYDSGIGMGGRARRGDEDAAPFYESGNISPTFCLVVDCASKLVWSGHKDGRIRSWSMDRDQDDEPIKEGLSWQAHKGPVLSLVISSHGDLWSGSEGGVIRIWTWEAIDKSLSLSPEERHMATLLVERSMIDLRSLVMVNGVCSISSSDVKCLLSDSVRGKVWAAGSFSFSLWDARTRELVKVYNIEGQIENRNDMSFVQDQPVEEETSVKPVTKSKKEKSQGGFLQRSRNAIMGAADAVRRVATKGAFVDDTKRTEALVQTLDGTIWTGCSNGLLCRWDGNGNRLQEFQHHHSAVQCFCTISTRLWVGYVSGTVQILDLEGNIVASWIAHTGPVLKLVVARGYVFSLATHGGIRGWHISSPGPLDQIIRTDLAAKELSYTREENVRLLVGTWNVGQGRASHEALMTWLGSTLADVGIVVIGLQEVEMGAGFLAMSAAKETVGLEGSAIGQWWQDTLGKALDEGTTFERVGSRQLAGLLIAIWVRKTLRPHVGDLDVSAVACGLGRAIGNKGGVGLRIRVYDRIMCFVNCHLAAHLEAVNRRNADFDHIFRTMVFTRSSNLQNTPAAGVSSSTQVARTTNQGGTNSEEGQTNQKPKKGEDARPDLAEADFVLFLGDFNYRLFGISYDEARDFVSQRSFDWLREKDQLRAEMKAGRAFQGMREALIRFPPTYKFERGKPGLGGYDSGEKKRIPAWCDRIIFRDNRVSSNSECSLECPVVTSVLQYEACMDVTESDHKPVRCKLNMDISRIDRSVRREEFGDILKSNEKVETLLQQLSHVPETSVGTDSITLQNQEASILKISNRSSADNAIFEIICQGQCIVDEKTSGYFPRGSFGFPRWLEVSPAGGVIGPDQAVEVSVRHEEFRSQDEAVEGVPQSWWNENTRDKEVILLVNIFGNSSMEKRTHRVTIRHHFTGNTEQACSIVQPTRTDSKNNSKRFQTTGS